MCSSRATPYTSIRRVRTRIDVAAAGNAAPSSSPLRKVGKWRFVARRAAERSQIDRGCNVVGDGFADMQPGETKAKGWSRRSANTISKGSNLTHSSGSPRRARTRQRNDSRPLGMIEGLHQVQVKTGRARLLTIVFLPQPVMATMTIAAPRAWARMRRQASYPLTIGKPMSIRMTSEAEQGNTRRGRRGARAQSLRD